jgi:signal transduction histidine kinase
MTDTADFERERRARLANMRQELLAPVTALVGYGEMLVEEARRLELAPVTCSNWSTGCSMLAASRATNQGPISPSFRPSSGTTCVIP